jgi:2,5-diamino-6-(ribosylamino)-4(3H)-pyrimidinone 5'-phosphate reductase
MSADGKIALPSRVQTSISSNEDFKRVHELRNSLDAVLVGIGTVLSDDPGLRVKPEFVSEPRDPTRVLLDSKLRVEPTHKIVNDTAPTLIFCTENTEVTKEFGPNVEVIKCGQDRVDIERALGILKERGIETLMVEGGEEVIWSFMNQGQFDKITMFVGSFIIGGKTSPTPAGGPGASSLERAVKLRLVSSQQLGNGVLLEYSPI